MINRNYDEELELFEHPTCVFAYVIRALEQEIFHLLLGPPEFNWLDFGVVAWLPMDLKLPGI